MIGSLAPRYGGPTTAAFEMSAALAERGHDVELVTTDIDGSKRLTVPLCTPLDLQGVTVTYYPVQWPRSYELSLPLGRALRRKVREADVVHIDSLYLFHGLIAGYYGRRYEVPYVLRPHGTLNPYHRARHPVRKLVYETLFERRNLNHAAGVVCMSKREREHVAAAGVRSPLYVVPLGIDADFFAGEGDFASLVSVHPELAGRRLVTFLGRLTAKKRLDLVLDAFALVARGDGKLHLAVAGPDDEGIGAELRRRVRGLGLDRHVSLLGFVDGERKLALLRRSLAFVLPSEDENFGVAVVEAMAAGVPVVVTRGVGIHERIAEAGAGLVVPTEAPAVAAAIRRLADDPALSTRFGANARRLVEEHFSRKETGRRLEEMYVEVIERRRATE